MTNYRLRSNPRNREEAFGYIANKIKPAKVFFLALEGTETERIYFEGVKKYANELGIDGDIIIEPLQRQDTNAAPTNVLELLEECISTVSMDDDEFVCAILVEIKNKIGEESIKKFIENDNEYIKEEEEKFDVFKKDCEIVGLDVQYKSYLVKLTGVGTEKVFCLVIDRDRHGINLERCFAEVARIKKEFVKDPTKGRIEVYLSSPCFDFWLLLHHTDCQSVSIELDKIKLNKREGKRGKTYTEKQLGHNKTKFDFKEKYMNKVDIAIENSRLYETDIEKIKDGIGTNLLKLFEELRK